MHPGVFAQVADRLAHVLRSGRAVEADHIHDRHSLDRRQHRTDIGTQNRASRHFEEELCLNRDIVAVEFAEAAPDAIQGGLDFQHVERRLDQQHVRAAFDQGA